MQNEKSIQEGSESLKSKTVRQTFDYVAKVLNQEKPKTDSDEREFSHRSTSQNQTTSFDRS